jgi:hypothetical protein
MSDSTFAVPSNSYSELKKIIKAYSHAGKKISLTEASKLTGMAPTAISGCNKFLVQLGILSKGANKQSSDLGAKLGKALEHKQEGEIQRLLGQVVSASEFLSNVVSAVRIKEGMVEDSLVSHILYVAGQKNTPSSKTGARAIVALLSESGAVRETDGKFTVSTAAPTGENDQEDTDEDGDEEEQESRVELRNRYGKQDDETPARNIVKRRTGTERYPNITININLQLPDTPDPQIYENFFKAMKTYLLTDE